jgi:hypothetical protein
MKKLTAALCAAIAALALAVTAGELITGTVTIQQTTESRGADGSIVDAWSNLANHVDLDCQVVPETTQSRREIRRQDQTYTKSTHTIHLTAAYASITEKMRAVSGGQTFNVLLAYTDSQGVHTSLICELVE